jgi:hypothetical protein
MSTEPKSSSEDFEPKNLETGEQSAVIDAPAPAPAPAPSQQSQIPNGGLQAWLQVLGAHLLFFNSWYESRHLREQILSLCH